MSFEKLLKQIDTQKYYLELARSSSTTQTDPLPTSPLNQPSFKNGNKPRKKKGGRVFNQDAIQKPFFLSGITSQRDKLMWLYVDEHDRLQGPFSSIQMDAWYEQKMLPFDLLVGVWGKSKMVRLGDFVMATYPFQKNPKIYLKKTE